LLKGIRSRTHGGLIETTALVDRPSDQAIVMSAGRQIRQASKQAIKNKQCGRNPPKGVPQAESHKSVDSASQGGYSWPIANWEQRYATIGVSHRREEPAVPQYGMCRVALLIFSFRPCPLFVLFIFLLVLTCTLLWKLVSGRHSLSLYTQGGAPSLVRPNRLLIQVRTAVRQSKVVDLLEMRRLKGEGYSPGRWLPTIQRDVLKICKPRAAAS